MNEIKICLEENQYTGEMMIGIIGWKYLSEEAKKSVLKKLQIEANWEVNKSNK